MEQIPKGWLDFLRQQYPVGSRIKLREMKNDPNPVESGSMGTLRFIDDAGTFHTAFDNGRELGVILGEDSFTVLPPTTQTLKLYMPMTATYYDIDEDDGSEIDITMDSREVAEYAPQIIAALQKERSWMEEHADSPEEAERGLMAYYGEEDGVDQKVKSCHFTAEVRDGQLWGVAECKVQGQLTPEEMDRLLSNVTGQASDGVGRQDHPDHQTGHPYLRGDLRVQGQQGRSTRVILLIRRQPGSRTAGAGIPHRRCYRGASHGRRPVFAVPTRGRDCQPATQLPRSPRLAFVTGFAACLSPHTPRRAFHMLRTVMPAAAQ